MLTRVACILFASSSALFLGCEAQSSKGHSDPTSTPLAPVDLKPEVSAQAVPTKSVNPTGEQNAPPEPHFTLRRELPSGDGSPWNYWISEPTSGTSAIITKIATYRCDAKWNETCEGHPVWKPRDGWEICKYTATVESISRGEWAANATPKQIGIYLKSWGSQLPLDRWGGWVQVNLASVELISKDETAEQRAQRGCSYNNQSGVDGELIKLLFCAKHPTKEGFGVQMCQRYKSENGKEVFYGAPFPCGACLEGQTGH